jgi:hypothetical protein
MPFVPMALGQSTQDWNAHCTLPTHQRFLYSNENTIVSIQTWISWRKYIFVNKINQSPLKIKRLFAHSKLDSPTAKPSALMAWLQARQNLKCLRKKFK